MNDARFVHNSPTCDVDLIVELLGIYSDCKNDLNEKFHIANIQRTDAARQEYLNRKNYLGINIRLAFISHMQNKNTYFDVEEALNAIQKIHNTSTAPRFTVVGQ